MAHFNIIGFASSTSGLGVVAREFARALLAKGHSVSILDFNTVAGLNRVDLSLDRYFVSGYDALPQGINLWIDSALGLPTHALTVCNLKSVREQFNVAFVWWELPDITPFWALSVQAFDAVVTGSEFVREAWSAAVSGVPVLLARHPLTMPAAVLPSRARFGLPEDAILYYTGFDPASDPARKNPFAAIDAFRAAFPTEDDVRLVIKANNPGSEQGSRAQMEQLRKMIEGDPRIQLIEKRLDYDDLLSLYASCDVIVSLHRSEGLGLMPLEAMRLGKPVVATGWSGNMTYMSHCNAALVDYDMGRPDESSVHYAPSRLGVQSRWAEPRIEHAAAWFRRLRADRELRRTLGETARRDSLLYDEAALAIPFADELGVLRSNSDMRPKKDYSAIRRSAYRGRQKLRRMQLKPASRLWATVKETCDEAFERHLAWRFRRA